MTAAAERLRGPRDLALGTALALFLGSLAAFIGTGFLEPTRAIALLAGLIFLAIAFIRLPVALGLLVFFTFFEAVPGGYNLVRGATAAVILVWLLLASNRSERPPSLLSSHPWLSYSLAFIVVWAFSSSLWASESGAAIGAAARLTPAVALAFVTFAAVRSREDIRSVLLGYILGGLLTATVGIAAGFGGAADDEDRYGGLLGDPNFLAAALVAGITFAAFMIPGARSAVGRTLLAAAIVGLGAGLLLTESRGGFVALGAALLLMLTFGGSVRRYAIAAVVVVACAGFVVYATTSSVGQLERISEVSADGGSGRTDVWAVAWQVARDEPILGVGAGNFKLVEPSYASRTINLLQPGLVVHKPRVAHNMYLEVLAELGIVGLVAFLSAIAATLAIVLGAVRRLARAGDRQGELLARGVFIGTATLLVAYVFLSGQYEKPLWMLFALGAAVGVRTRGEDLAAAHYDREVSESMYGQTVSEHVLEQLLRTFDERLEALLAETRRLERRRASLSSREAELKQRGQGLAPREGSSSQPAELEQRERRLAEREAAFEAKGRRTVESAGKAAEERERELARREAVLEERIRSVTARELAVARRAAAAAAAVSREAEALVTAPAPSAAPPAEPPPSVEPAPVSDEIAASAELTLPVLERLVAAQSAASPAEIDEWNYTLLYLRDYADASGNLPSSFDSLLDDVFGSLVDTPRDD